MKKTILILLSFIAILVVKAQDRIITLDHDTIECRIVSVGNELISYEQKTADNYLVGKSIPMAEVLHYLRSKEATTSDDFYRDRGRRSKPEHRFLLSLQGGLSNLINDFGDFKTSMTNQGLSRKEADDYISDFKSGYSVGMGVHYFLSNTIAVGVEYNLFHSSAELEFLGTGYVGYGVPAYLNQQLEEKVYCQFVGASALFTQFAGESKKLKFTETVSPGVMLFRDESRGNSYDIYWGTDGFYEGEPPQYINTANSLTTGKAFAARGSFALDYCFTTQLSAGIYGSFTWAKLHKASVKMLDYEVDEQELEDALDLSRIDYGFSVRYSF